MLSSSLRRAVRTTTSSSSATSAIVAFPSLLVPTTSTTTATTRQRRGAAQHQRRYSSSSKPPVPPNDGSRPIDASSSSQQAPANPSAGRKVKESQGRKAAAGDVTKSKQSSATFLNLPSVPSTQDTPIEGLPLNIKEEFSSQLLTARNCYRYQSGLILLRPQTHLRQRTCAPNKQRKDLQRHLRSQQIETRKPYCRGD